jgi:hypothetical protein
VKKYTRRAVERFFVMLDSEGVELFQWLFYLILAFDGGQNLFIAHDLPLSLQGTMAPTFFQWWAALEMVAPVCCLIGRALYNTPLYRAAANRFQLVGDLVLASSEAGFVVATFHSEPVGHGGHGGYLALAFMLSAALLAWRDVRRIKIDRRSDP